MPKCEFFNRSDFHDFYTIKYLWVDDFGGKMIFYIFRGSCALKFFTCMLSLILRRIFLVEFGPNNFFLELLRPYVSDNSNCLNFLLF